MDIVRVNIIMLDGTQLKDVWICRDNDLAKSIVKTKEEIEELFNHAQHQKTTVFFAGNFVQGEIILQQIQQYEIITATVKQKLERFFRDSGEYWNLNLFDVSSVSDFILDNRKELLQILR